MSPRLPRLPLLAVAIAVAATLLLGGLALPTPASADCPGAAPSCPYVSAGQIGRRGEGVLRFPQAVAVGPDGNVYVADQASHVVQVFAPDGTFLREVGISGTGPGQLTSVGAVAVAGDGSLFVADGTNRIDRFGIHGELLGSFGHGGRDQGALRFGADGGHSAGAGGGPAGAGGGLAVSGQFLYVADTGNDRILRFGLAGNDPRVLVPPGTLDVPQGLTVRGSRRTGADPREPPPPGLRARPAANAASGSATPAAGRWAGSPRARAPIRASSRIPATSRPPPRAGCSS